MIALCPEKLDTKAPSGHFHFLMLFPPAEPDAKEYSVGWMASARTDFLWCVSVTIVFPAARSHNLAVCQMDVCSQGTGDVPDGAVHASCDDLWI